jgi:hypothetical protein
MDEVRASWPSLFDGDDPGWNLRRFSAHAQRRARARCVSRASWRENALEHDKGVGSEAKVRDSHGLDSGGDRARIHERDVLANAAQRDVRAEGLLVECDVATTQLRAEALPEREDGRSAGADPEPDDAGTTRIRKAPRPVELDVEGSHLAHRGLRRGSHLREPLVGRLAQECESDVHQLRFYATQSRKIRDRAECLLGDLGREWERDEEPYPRRLEPCGVSLVSDQ